ncbi:hypothetical protein ACM614_30460 [Streptomyces sp. 12297]
MTSGGEEATAATSVEGIRRIPAVIQVVQPPAVTDARDALLAAIGKEAQQLADQSAGQASGALVELARAYALVALGASAVAGTTPVARAIAGDAYLAGRAK